MTVNPNDVVRATAKLIGPDLQQLMNVFFYKYEGTASSTDDTVMTLLAAHIDDIYETVDQIMNEDFVDDEIEFYNVTQDAPMGTKLFDGFQGGTSVTGGMPAGIAALITAATTVKKVLPKKYIPGFNENVVTQDNWLSTALTPMAAFAVAWLTKVTVGVVGELVPGTWRRVAEVFVPLISATAKSIVSYQRRRKPGVGI